MGGLCGVSHKQSESEVVHRTRGNNSNRTEPKKEEAKVDKFPDLEEHTDGRQIGEGIKQIPSYKCALPYDQLHKLREEFWASKKNSRVWLVLRTCCETDALSAKELLLAEDLQCIGSNLRCVLNTNNPEILYNVPNFCISDPVHERDFTPFMNEQINQKSFTIFCCYVFNNSSHKVEVSDTTLGSELRQEYSTIANLPQSKYRLRLLYKGQEIKEDHPLFYYNITENAKIQVSIADLEDSDLTKI